MIDASLIPFILPMFLASMTFWLSLVGICAYLAFKKWRRTDPFWKQQMLYLWLGSAFVFVGDLLHTVAYSISLINGDIGGTIHIQGSPFELWTFVVALECIVFMIYYALWTPFIVARYQGGRYEIRDKSMIVMAVMAVILVLPGLKPNAFGIYTQTYDLALWAPHTALYFVFALMTIHKLAKSSKEAISRSSEVAIQEQERALFMVTICFVFSFVFYGLTLALLPLNPLFGSIMAIKTFAYCIAFYTLIRKVVMITPNIGSS